MFGKMSRKCSRNWGCRLLSTALWFLLAAISLAGQSEPATAPRVHLIVVDGGINPAVDDFIRESINRAHSAGAKALIIQLDTPGGLL